MAGHRIAIVLFNLGGPDSPKAVRPFLVNLFTDPAILRVPFFVRFFLARFIAWRRTPIARANYAIIGGRSPLLDLTTAQADALAAALPELQVKCAIAMRYWHPFSDAAAAAVKAWNPDTILLLPLYPHYSTTTTGSSLTAWREAAARAGLVAPTITLCCWHSFAPYIDATAAIIRRAHDDARAKLAPDIQLRILFSAHGLPESIVKAGDPYQFQIEQTVAQILRRWGDPAPDSLICYQSRVTPQVWIGPSTEAEIRRAAAERVAVLVVPIAFVSDHTETLVELDVEYREIGEHAGIPGYFRAPVQNTEPDFIVALAALVRDAIARGPGLCSFAGGRLCPAKFSACPHIEAAA